MDDCCAVCANNLEWVAYGFCGHREVCSTCVVRLRFIFADRRCCICKTDCPVVFIAKNCLMNQHISSGDSEVDGSESERGGFTGHPMCEFCKSPFYGGNELYTHMSREHYTCHICQRMKPGQYEYYGNYDNLEAHFPSHHFFM